MKLEIGTGDKEVIVEYTVHPGYEGDYYQPPEPPEVEIQSIHSLEGFDLSGYIEDSTYERIEEMIMKRLEETAQDYDGYDDEDDIPY